MDRQREPEEKKDAAPPRSNGKEPSMSSKIAASASGLAKDILGSTSADEAQRAFASGSGLSRKLPNGAAGAGPSSWSQALPSRQNGSSSRASVGSGENLRSQEGFRDPASTSEQDPDFDFDAFLSAGAPSQSGLEHPGSAHTEWSQEFQNATAFPSNSQNGFSGLHEQSNGFHFQDNGIDTAQDSMNGLASYDDGAEVRLLLSDPTFSTDGLADVQMADPTPESVNGLFSQDYTPQEKEIVDKIKSSLPPPPQHNGVTPDNPLNLRPEFASLSASNPQLEEEIRELSGTLGSGEESYVFFNNAQQQHWFAEWDDVLNSYTDEVWGDMLPAVKAARSQLQEVKTGMDRLDNKAVARLRMILGHVVDTTQTSTTASSVAQDQSAVQQQALQSDMQDLHQLHQPMHQYNGMNGHNYGVQQPLYRRPVHEERHLQRKQEQKPEEDNEWEMPTFHCPYVSCHEVCHSLFFVSFWGGLLTSTQQFHNEFELRMHSNQHNGYSCPHTGCSDRFQDSKEWAEHINRAHHGLVQARPEDEETDV